MAANPPGLAPDGTPWSHIPGVSSGQLFANVPPPPGFSTQNSGTANPLPGAGDLGGGMPSGIPQGSFSNEAGPSGGGFQMPSLGKLGDVFGKGIDWATSNPDKLLALGTGLYGAYNAHQSNKLRGKALDSATGAYDERAPLRAAGIAGMANAQAPDLSSLFANPGDVYSNPPAPTLADAMAGTMTTDAERMAHDRAKRGLRPLLPRAR